MNRNLSEAQFHRADQPEQVRVDQLLQHREWDHGPGYSTEVSSGQQYAPKRTPEAWAAFRDDVRHNGIKSPLQLNYDPQSGRAYLGEGNSRLAMAHELGHTHVPVVGVRNKYIPSNTGALIEDDKKVEGHFPADFNVRGVLPDRYFD